MKLYYTVSSGNEVQQTKPQLSLGGYKSSSPLVNSQIGNLFSDITPVTINNFNQDQFIGLVLKNETGSIITGVNIWFEYGDSCYSKFSLAAVDMVSNADHHLIMEHIPTINSQPLSGDFVEADGISNAADVGGLAIDEQIGIWIKRTLLPDVVATQQASVYAPDPLLPGRFYEVVLPKLDEINLGISWT